MKILVVGTGLTGCAMARLLRDRSHSVSMIEKEDCIGGLCITRTNDAGLLYEPYGARVFHTHKEKISSFIQRFGRFNGYVHRKGLLIENELLPFPLSKTSLNQLKNPDQIRKELADRPSQIDTTNFKTASISILGESLYKLFVENYTRKMWGREPEELTRISHQFRRLQIRSF